MCLVVSVEVTESCSRSVELTKSQAIVPILHPLWFYPVSKGLEFFIIFAGRFLTSDDQITGMIHDGSIRTLKIVPNGSQNGAGLFLIRIVSEMKFNVARVVTLKYRHDVVDTADGKENEMFALGVHERSENGVLVQLELGLAMSRRQPRRPDANQREPSRDC